MCIIVENESDVAAFKDFVDDTPAEISIPTALSSPKTSTYVSIPPLPKPTASKASASSNQVPIQIGSRILVSPLAKRIAVEKGLDLNVRFI